MSTKLRELLKELHSDFTTKEIMEIAKEMHKEQAKNKSTWLPSTRCTFEFRKETEESAIKTGKSITEYIIDSIKLNNKKLRGE